MEEEISGIGLSIFLCILLELQQKQVHHWKEHYGLETTAAFFFSNLYVFSALEETGNALHPQTGICNMHYMHTAYKQTVAYAYINTDYVY
jgi:hypothetical protein